MNKLLPAGSQH